MEELRAKIESRKVVDIWHNNVEKIPWPPSPPVDEKSLENAVASLAISKQGMASSKHAYIHRKGAAPTYNPYTKTPLPILPLPGSRATPTLILRPKFSAATGWGLYNAMSLAHGAGRSMSRAKALASLGSKYKNPSALLVPTAASQETKSANGEDVQGGTWGRSTLLIF
jgi:RNA-splicing ligase RtcB